MKLKAMAQQDPAFRASGRRGLRAVRIDAGVWSDFASDPISLAAEVDRISTSILTRSSPSMDSAHLAADDRRMTRSTGPPPSFGTVMTERYDSECVVYVLRFEGPLQALFPPGRVPDGWIVAKLGRTNDVGRRVAELSAGIPPGTGLAWTVLEIARYPTAVAAQSAEQALLNLAEGQGWTLGGEFVIAPQHALLAALRSSPPMSTDLLA